MRELPPPPPTLRVFVAGCSGSGKTTWAWRLFVARFPRRLVWDVTGEWTGRADVEAHDVASLHGALAGVARRGRWTIRLTADLGELAGVARYLVPVPDVSRSPVRALGGAVLLADEADLWAPPGGLAEGVRTLWRRSRHAGLSIVACTQRPEAVSREVSAQSRYVLVLRQVEPRAYDYLGRLLGCDLRPGLLAWTEREPHGGVLADLWTRRYYWLSDAGALVPFAASSSAAAAGAADTDGPPSA